MFQQKYELKNIFHPSFLKASAYSKLVAEMVIYLQKPLLRMVLVLITRQHLSKLPANVTQILFLKLMMLKSCSWMRFLTI